MKYLLNILCLTCLLGFVGCSQDLALNDDGGKSVDPKTNSAKFDTTYVNINLGGAALESEETQKAMAELVNTRAVNTRAVRLDSKGKVSGDQKFIANCYLVNTKTGQLGNFTLDWTIKKNGKQIKLEGDFRRRVAIAWQHGTAPENISGNDWKVCGVAGGGKQDLKGAPGASKDCEAVSFEPTVIDQVNKGEVAIPFVSDYSAVKTATTAGASTAFLKFNFKFIGTLLKLKLKRDNTVTDDKDFFFNTTGLNPVGVFLMRDVQTKKPVSDKSLKDLWNSTAPVASESTPNADKYQIILRGDNATEVKEGANSYYVWYVWGMPNKDKSVAETTMGSLNGGYIIKQDNKQGPFWSRHNFKNDESKVKMFCLSVNKPEPFPSFNFLNILERSAEHNLEAPKTWWTSDYVKGARPKPRAPKGMYIASDNYFFKYEDAMSPDFMPEGYHLPSIDEMTVLFPYKGSTDPEEDLEWGKDFNNKTSPWVEWVTLYAYQMTYANLENNKKKWIVCDNASDASKDIDEEFDHQLKDIKDNFRYRNIKGFNSYFYKPDGQNVIYSIRFAENTVYGNKICCAYKWDYSKVDVHPNDLEKSYIEITSRWIGDAPLKIDDITKPEWWENNKKYNVVRRLPAQGEVTAKDYKSYLVAGTYLCSGKYYFKNTLSGVYARTFNSKWSGGGFQRKTYGIGSGLIRPFKNKMMCNERGDEYSPNFFEENTGKGKGQNL
ncbi:hypothetical protein ABVC73_01345 [Prevotella melaninogenica]